jgi:hypothetical protein
MAARPILGLIQKSTHRSPVQKCQTFAGFENWKGRAIGSAPDFPKFFIFPEPSFAQHFRLMGRMSFGVGRPTNRKFRSFRSRPLKVI